MPMWKRKAGLLLPLLFSSNMFLIIFFSQHPCAICVSILLWSNNNTKMWLKKWNIQQLSTYFSLTWDSCSPGENLIIHSLFMCLEYPIICDQTCLCSSPLWQKHRVNLVPPAKRAPWLTGRVGPLQGFCRTLSAKLRLDWNLQKPSNIWRSFPWGCILSLRYWGKHKNK